MHPGATDNDTPEPVRDALLKLRKEIDDRRIRAQDQARLLGGIR